MKVRFFLRNGVMIEWPVPADQAVLFNFGTICGLMRLNGFFQAEGLHVPYAEIVCVGLDSDGAGAADIKTPDGLPGARLN